NGAEATIHATEKSLKDVGDKLSAADKGRVESAINELKEALKSDNIEAIKAKTSALTQASMKLGEALSGAQAGGGSAWGTGGGGALWRPGRGWGGCGDGRGWWG